MCNFRVGQKVVCVNAEIWDEKILNVRICYGLDGLRKGAIYTIRSVYMDPGYGSIHVRLAEIQRGDSIFKGERYECGYAPERFRPVVTRKTSIEIFKKMLNNNTVDA